MFLGIWSLINVCVFAKALTILPAPTKLYNCQKLFYAIVVGFSKGNALSKVALFPQEFL